MIVVDETKHNSNRKNDIISEALCVFKKPINKKPKIITTELSNKKRNYKKFDEEQILILKKSFENNSYPTKNEMQNLAAQFKERFSKIENWFKHQRKKNVQKGTMKFTKKKTFSRDENHYLMKEFLKCTKPKYQRFKEMAKILNCDIKHIKNWFGYKRKMIIKIRKGKFLSEDQKFQAQEKLKKCDLLFINSNQKLDIHSFPFENINSSMEIEKKMAKDDFVVKISEKIEEKPIAFGVNKEKIPINTHQIIIPKFINNEFTKNHQRNKNPNNNNIQSKEWDNTQTNFQFQNLSKEWNKNIYNLYNLQNELSKFLVSALFQNPLQNMHLPTHH